MARSMGLLATRRKFLNAQFTAADSVNLRRGWIAAIPSTRSARCARRCGRGFPSGWVVGGRWERPWMVDFSCSRGTENQGEAMIAARAVAYSSWVRWPACIASSNAASRADRLGGVAGELA
jgi:hypothetical protein